MVTISRGMLLLFLGFFFGFLFFLGGFVHADGVHSAERAESPLTQSPFALELSLRLDSEPGPRNGFQTALGNLFARQFADAIGIFFDSLERFFNFVDGVLVRRQ